MKSLVMTIPLILIGAAVLFQRQPQEAGNTRREVITPAEVHTRMQQKDTSILLLDVRTREEFADAGGHLEGAMLIPVQELSRQMADLESVKDRTVIVYCRSGNRSGYAAEMLRARGFRALNMVGGMIQWHRQRFPVTRGLPQ